MTNRRIIFAFCLISLSTLLMASVFLHKNRNEVDKRENPADRKSYQFQEYVGDANGDGVPDFTVSATALTPFLLHITISGIGTNIAGQAGYAVDNGAFTYRAFASSFDIPLSGTFGTFSVKVLIQCRDGKESKISIVPFTVEPVVFVSPAGNNTNEGSRLFPVRSIQKGIERAVQRGITVINVQQGVYSRGNGLNDSADFGLVISNHNLRIRGGFDDGFTAQSGSSMLGNTYEFDSGTEINTVVLFADATNIMFDGFTVWGAGQCGILLSNASACILTNLVIVSNGIDAGGFGLSSSDAHSNTICANVNRNKGYRAIYVQGNYNTIRSEVHRNMSTGIEIRGTGNIVDAIVHRNTNSGLWLQDSINAVISGAYYLNSNAYEGGGIHLAWGSNNVINAAVFSNTAALRGGGISIYGSAATTITGPVYGNTASNGGGSAVLGDAVNTVFSGMITNNRALSNGGGLYVSSMSNTKISGTVEGNQAFCGGGISTWAASNTVISGSVIHNGASYAAGIYAYADSGLYVSGTIAGNYADGDFGAMLLVACNNARMTNAFITNNGCDGTRLIVLSNSIANMMFSNCTLGARSGDTYTLFYETGINTSVTYLVSNTIYTNDMGILYRNYNGTNITVNTTTVGNNYSWHYINSNAYFESAIAADNVVSNR